MLLLPACMRAQTGQFFNPDKQLSSSFVTQVYFDKDGYLWATTRNGINRYDGYQFHVFRKENEQYKTLESNYVNTMLQDRRGLFYFGMYGSLQTWDGNTYHYIYRWRTEMEEQLYIAGIRLAKLLNEIYK